MAKVTTIVVPKPEFDALVGEVKRLQAENDELATIHKHAALWMDQSSAFKWDAVKNAHDEVERLRAELHQAKAEWFEEKKRARELEAEVVRLRRENRENEHAYELEHERTTDLVQENERLRGVVTELQACCDLHQPIINEAERLRARNGRLRKAVNWLRGALHDAENEHVPATNHFNTIDECEAWECQRARAILDENRDEA